MNTENFFFDKVKACIAVLHDHVQPKGVPAKKTINDLLGLLDNDEIVTMMNIAAKKPPPFPGLTRPLCCIDLETTGTDVDADLIVEISVVKIYEDGKEDVRTHRINPLIPIPEAATAVHGITNEMVKDCPTFANISKALLDFITGCDILGFHSNRFDVPFLSSMFTRVGLFWDWRAVNLIDAAVIFKRKEERTLSAGVKFYLGVDHDSAHSAEGDIMRTKELFFQQYSMYADIPRAFSDLALYCSFDEPILDFDRKFKMKDGKVVFTFGKHVDQEATKHKDFLQWMLTKDFSKDTKDFVKKLLLA
jgi:DNA polymerase-3 subunit epsilon